MKTKNPKDIGPFKLIQNSTRIPDKFELPSHKIANGQKNSKICDVNVRVLTHCERSTDDKKVIFLR